MRFTVLVIGCCFAIANCSSDDVGPAGPASAFLTSSGSRLKLRYRSNGNGLRKEFGFFDSERNEACALGADENGNFACVPTNTVSQPSEVFLTADCDPNQKALLVEKSCDSAKLYEKQEADIRETTCTPNQPTVYRELVPVENPPTQYYRSSRICYGSVCQTICDAVPLQDRQLVTRGNAVPSAAFVSFEITKVGGRGRLDIVALKGADGTLVQHRGPNNAPMFYDNELKVRCTVKEFEDACRPIPSNFDRSIYADADCSVPAFGGLDCPGLMDEQRYAEVDGRYFKMGDAVGGFHRNGSTCEFGVGDSSLEKAYAVKDEVDFTKFARTVLSPSTYGRVRVLDQVRLGDEVLLRTSSDSAYWDTELNLACRPTDLPDGTSYCVPNVHNRRVPVRYSDSGCANPIYFLPVRDVTSGPVPTYAVVTGPPDENQCNAPVEIRKVGNKSKISEAYEKSADGDCSGAYSDVEAYDLSESAPLDQLAKMEVKKD